MWGTGGLIVVGCCFGFNSDSDRRAAEWGSKGGAEGWGMKPGAEVKPTSPAGRFPANLVLSCCGQDPHEPDCAVRMLDEQSGVTKSGDHKGFKRANLNANTWSTLSSECKFQNKGDSGGASRFFYCAKVSSRERNAGLDKLYSCELDLSSCKEENTEVVALLLKAIFGSMPNLSIVESGDRITVTSQKDTLSTIRTVIQQITGSKILSWLTHSHTSGCIQDVSCEEEHGGSLAPFAKNLKELMIQIGTLPGKDGSLLVGAVPATLSLLSIVKEESAWKPKLNVHPTIKSQRLMRYLCRLITPPGGTVLDPFMGSGSTGCAAIQEGFRFIGIEREAEYLEIARRRIEHARKAEYLGGQQAFSVEGPQDSQLDIEDLINPQRE
jgi:hypothetical protein